jgi:aspartyl-tRNA(Asn)/glutamyl-tRNA(Gln) amidotransferase subunit A
MLNLLAGYDPRDLRTRAGALPDFTVGLERADGVRGLRIGAVREDGSQLEPPEPAALAAWEAGLDALRAGGAEIVDLALPELEELRVIGSAIIGMEAVAYHEPALRERLRDFGPSVRERLILMFAYGPDTYVQAQQARAVLRARFDRLWERVDLLSLPALPHGAPLLGEAGQNTRYSIPFNVLGWPAIVVPTGLTDNNLPLATEVIGQPWDEVTVLRAGWAIERSGLWRGRRPAGY